MAAISAATSWTLNFVTRIQIEPNIAMGTDAFSQCDLLRRLLAGFPVILCHLKRVTAGQTSAAEQGMYNT